MNKQTTVERLCLKIRMKSREAEGWKERLGVYTNEEIGIAESRSYTSEKMCWFQITLKDIVIVLDEKASNDIRLLYHLSKEEHFICDAMSFTKINPASENTVILVAPHGMVEQSTEKQSHHV